MNFIKIAYRNLAQVAVSVRPHLYFIALVAHL